MSLIVNHALEDSIVKVKSNNPVLLVTFAYQVQKHQHLLMGLMAICVLLVISAMLEESLKFHVMQGHICQKREQ